MIKAIKNLIDKDEALYVAVSMGVDSLAAIHWLIWKRYKVVGLHFNHKMREQNDEMENSFKKFCSDFGIEGICGKGKNLKTEADCRKARIEFYENTLIKGKVITAHHLNDWVEGYLLNCFRGKATHEPIPLISQFQNYQIVHPFLLTKKKDFEEYVDRNNLSKYTIQDESNAVLKGSRRNWIRNVILPEMALQKLSLEKYAKRQISKLLLESVK